MPVSRLKCSLIHTILGLSSEERTIVENLFRNGDICFLAATTTLAAGVNLPAGRVLIRSMRVGHNQTLEPIQYRQMCGRAGRPGLTSYGESFLIVRQSDKKDALALCNRPLPKISSQIHPSIDGGKAFLKVLLELFLLRLCDTVGLVKEYATQTMVYLECTHSCSHTLLMESLTSLLNFLISANAIEVYPIDNPHQILKETPSSIFLSSDDHQKIGIRVTRFGRAVAESNLNPDEAISIYEDLIRAREQGINLESNLHLLYLITPQNHSLPPNYKTLLNVYEQSKSRVDGSIHLTFDAIGLDTNLLVKWTHLPPSYEQLSSCVDRLKLFKIKSSHISSASTSSCSSKLKMSESDCIMLYRCLRLWAASALSMLLETQSLTKVAATYGVSVNDIANLQKSACYLSSRVVRFCQEIGWLSVEKLMSYISSSISFEPDKEVKELMVLDGMSTKLARTLYDHGYDTIQRLASANEEDIVHRLLLSRQFEISQVS